MSRFPQVRTTLGGVSAAMGKLGATLGSACFKPLVGVAGTAVTMLVCAAVSIAGFVITYFFVEDRRGLALEGEDGGPEMPGTPPPDLPSGLSEIVMDDETAALEMQPIGNSLAPTPRSSNG
mmetsp:Transcript_10451/g.22190  ORF Transcript_10451/g.22190 Transcript_10451/m.22190 type:complete len:121 (-) Transcript_10451:96-458(-)